MVGMDVMESEAGSHPSRMEGRRMSTRCLFVKVVEMNVGDTFPWTPLGRRMVITRVIMLVSVA